MSSSTSSFLWRANLIPIAIVSFYILFVALLTQPSFQAHNVFLHTINWPFSNLEDPSKTKGISPGQARNVRIKSSDGVEIGAWHLLPKDLWKKRTETTRSEERSEEEEFDQALLARPTVLYLHGNAMNRAAPFRVEAYGQLTNSSVSSQGGLNVVAIDYRGFGDSTGHPTEQGVLCDARAAWRWVMHRRRLALQRNQLAARTTTPVSFLEQGGGIYLVGQSLGTGIASRLMLDLARVGNGKDRPPEALFLVAPYTSIFALLSSYKLGGLIPILWPLNVWQYLSDLADRSLTTRFESDKAIRNLFAISPRHGKDQQLQLEVLPHTLDVETLKSQLGLDEEQETHIEGALARKRPHIIVAHADDDPVIPHTHGRSLFNTARVAAGQSEEDVTVQETSWGHIYSTTDESGRKSALIRNKQGGHNGVPESTIEAWARLVSLRP